MTPEGEDELRCPVCNAVMSPEGGEGSYSCARCGSEALFRGEELLAMKIPGFESRLQELQGRHAEVLALIEAESGRGSQRDMRALRSLHEERQRVLSEYSYMGYFRQFVERWQER